MIGELDHLNRSGVFAIDENLIIHNERGEHICMWGNCTKERRVLLQLTKNRSRAIIENLHMNFLMGYFLFMISSLIILIFLIILLAILMKHMHIKRIISDLDVIQQGTLKIIGLN